MHKADKELSEVAARWEEIKKGTSQVQHGVLHYFHKIVTCAKSQHNTSLVQCTAALPYASRTAGLQILGLICNTFLRCTASHVASLFVMQVKNEVQPIQEAEAARIKSEVAVFSRGVTDYQKGFRSRLFYKYSTGAERAYPEIDQASCSLC